MKNNKFLKFGLIGLFALVLITGAVSFKLNYAKAEQSGSTPESGSTSRILTIYNSLVALGNGADAAGGWGDWGAKWNRIRSAAEWMPSGNADVALDVRSGKTFFKDSRTEQTGTYPAPGPCSTQQYHDNYGAPVTQTTNCTDTVAWTVPSPVVTGDDKKDPRTGIVWSQLLRNNAGTVEFSAAANSTWSWDGTTDPDNIAVGGKTASALCSERGNGWRLPTQKELMQAYIDGSYFNLTQPSNLFWSATENDSTNAWYVTLYSGYTSFNIKTGSHQVRCVR